MTGAQLFEIVRKDRPALPLVLASGFADLPRGARALAVKLVKPFDHHQLAEAIATAIGPGSPA
jgi:FixJ family two-component response regulator